MTAWYRIRPGERLIQPDGKILTGGDIIELPDELAAMHAHRLETQQVPQATEEEVHIPYEASKD